MFVRPASDTRPDRDAEGLFKIRDPDMQDFLPANGREVPASNYWNLRVRDGDVIVGKAPAEPVVAEGAHE